MEFQYDNDGSTSIVFFLTVVLIYLISATWSRLTKNETKNNDADGTGLTSLCAEKDAKIQARKDAQKTFWSSIPWGDIIYALAWIAFLFLAYKVSQFETTEGYDPYKILGLGSGAEEKEIKKAYRQLSRLTHPDRNPDDPEAPDKFMRIRKAYEALTDEETRDNLEEYGNPEGRQELSFGIALPAWLVAKDNAMYVLVVYGLVFMILLPIVIGTWWYNRNYSFSEDVLNDTKIIFWNYFKDKNVRHQVLIERLSWCAEFQQLPTRERDGEFFQKKLHPAIGELPKIEKWRFMQPKRIGLEWDLKMICCIKARYLMHAHLSRVLDETPLSSELEKDYYFILRRVPVLIDSMVELFHERSRQNGVPALQPMLAIMHLHQQFVQAFSSPRVDPLLQVPWVDDRAIKMLKGKKSRIMTLMDLYKPTPETRAKLLKDFSASQLDDVEKFGAVCPLLNVTYRIKVGQEDEVSTGSFVTLVAELERKPINSLEMTSAEEEKLLNRVEKGTVVTEETAEDKEAAALAYLQSKTKKGKTVRRKKKSTVGAQPVAAAENDNEDDDASEDEAPKPTELDDDEEDVVPNPPPQSGADDNDDDKSSDDSDDEDAKDESDDDFDWEANDEEIRIERERQKREREQAAKNKDSCPVHCPRFPDPKQEAWWVFLADDLKGRMITPPKKIMNLKDRREVDIVFAAPPRAGTYKLNLYVVSDSYIGLDRDIKVNLTVEKGDEPEIMEAQEDEVETEDSEQEFMLSDESDDEDF